MRHVGKGRCGGWGVSGDVARGGGRGAQTCCTLSLFLSTEVCMASTEAMHTRRRAVRACRGGRGNQDRRLRLRQDHGPTRPRPGPPLPPPPSPPDPTPPSAMRSERHATVPARAVVCGAGFHRTRPLRAAAWSGFSETGFSYKLICRRLPPDQAACQDPRRGAGPSHQAAGPRVPGADVAPRSARAAGRRRRSA